MTLYTDIEVERAQPNQHVVLRGVVNGVADKITRIHGFVALEQVLIVKKQEEELPTAVMPASSDLVIFVLTVDYRRQKKNYPLSISAG